MASNSSTSISASSNPDVGTWTPEQVAAWVAEKGFEQSIANLFVTQKVDGLALLEMTQDDVKGPPFNFVFGDAKKFMRDVNTLCPTAALPHGIQASSSTELTGPTKKYFSVSGVDPSKNFCCFREHALHKITEKFVDREMWRGGSILVQAAPTSGKTGFISLFQSRMTQYNTVSVTMHGADDARSFMDDLKIVFNKQQLLQQGDELKDLWYIIDNPHTLWKDPSKPLVLLIDEGQHLFAGTPGSTFLQKIKERSPSKIYALIVFSMYDINTVTLAMQRGDPGSAGDWVVRYFYTDLLKWTWADTKEYFLDYHTHNRNGNTVTIDVQKIIFEKCDGHGGYISTLVFGISRYCHSNSIGVFSYSEWLRYLRTNFNSDMDQVRSSVSVADLLHVNELSGAIDICQQLVLQCSMKLDPLNSNVRWLIKLGIIQSIGQSKFAFTSSVMRVVFLRCLVTEDLTNVPTKVLYKDPLAFLMACLPLIKQKSIQKCISTTSRDGKQTQKEDVWVCQIFAAAQSILPLGCVVEPQFTSKDTNMKKKVKRVKRSTDKEENDEEADDKEADDKEKSRHGEVDIIVHNGSTYLLEFLITEAKTSTAKKYIEEHLARFTPNGKYTHSLQYPAAVVNVTHIPKPIEVNMPQGCTAQLFHFCVAEDLMSANLIWTEKGEYHEVPIQFGSSMFYNTVTKKYGYLDPAKP